MADIMIKAFCRGAASVFELLPRREEFRGKLLDQSMRDIELAWEDVGRHLRGAMSECAKERKAASAEEL